MRATITKYLPPTNTKPNRYKAECERGSLTVSADHALNVEENHRAVCDTLCAKFDAEDAKQYGSTTRTWSRPKAGGAIPSGEYVFCFIQPRVLDRDALVKAARDYLEQASVTNRSALRRTLEEAK